MGAKRGRNGVRGRKGYKGRHRGLAGTYGSMWCTGTNGSRFAGMLLLLRVGLSRHTVSVVHLWAHAAVDETL